MDPLTQPFELALQFNILPVINLQVKHCDTPITALAKIGGLVFLLRISLVLNYVHQLMFDCKMRKKFPKKKKSQVVR